MACSILLRTAAKQGAYWFIDNAALEVCSLLSANKEWFGVVTLAVKADETAVMSMTDGNETILHAIDIRYTDLQTGGWRFFLSHDGQQWILLLPSEY